MFGSLIDKYELSKTTAIRYIESLKQKKVISVLMKYFHANQELIFSSVFVPGPRDYYSGSTWYTSVT